MKRKLIALFFLISFILPAQATCIFIWRINNIIYVGTDSMSTRYGSNGEVETVKNICKVNHVGNIYYAVSGYGDETVAELTANSLRYSMSIDGAISMLAPAYINVSSRTVDSMQIANKALYRNRFANTTNQKILYGAVSFFGFEFNQPTIKTVYFYIISPAGKPTVMVPEVKYNDKVIHGKQEIINEAQKSIKEINLSTIDYIEKFIDFQTKKVGSMVGGPIRLLEISPNGVKWIKNKGDCK